MPDTKDLGASVIESLLEQTRAGFQAMKDLNKKQADLLTEAHGSHSETKDEVCRMQAKVEELQGQISELQSRILQLESRGP